MLPESTYRARDEARVVSLNAQSPKRIRPGI